jgi:hypothetical protein
MSGKLPVIPSEARDLHLPVIPSEARDLHLAAKPRLIGRAFRSRARSPNICRMGTRVRINRFAMPDREPPAMLWVRRVVIAAAVLTILLFSWSIYRRVWQVLRLDLRTSSTVIVPGTVVSTDVITTGEVPNPIRLELVQGAHFEILMERHGGMPTVRSFDPRLFRYTPTITISPGLLARFTPGPATLRLTGVGMQKLLRTPPPRIRELPVTLGSRR